MNILIVMSGGFDTYGPSRHLYQALIEDLLKHGDTIHLIESHSTGVDPDVPDVFKKFMTFSYDLVKRDVVEKKAFAKRYIAGLKYTYRCRKPLKHTKNKYDVVLVQSCVWAPFMVPLVKKKTKSTVVWNIQDMFPGASIANGVLKNSFLKKIFFKLHKRAYKKADYITVISEDMKRKVNEQGVSNDKVTVIPDWYDSNSVKFIPWDQNEFVKKYNLKRDTFYVQFAGTMGFNFNYKVVLEIASLLLKNKNIQFQMIGFGSQYDDFKNEAEKSGLTNIVFYPLQPQSTVSHVYSSCSLAIIPLPLGVIGNSVPSKIGLLMECRKPILSLADKNSEYLKMINANNIGVGLDSNDSAGAAKTIIELSENTELCNKMGNNAFLFGHELYSRKINTKKYIDLFYLIRKERKS